MSASGRAVIDPRESLLQLVEAATDIEGRFTHLQRLGASGAGGYFSLLFSAHDGATGKRVAIKVFDLTRMDSYRLASFEREARLLQHFSGQPDIIAQVAPHGHFSVSITGPGGVAIPVPFQYYAMELAQESVEDAILRESWGPVQTLRAFRVMCRAVQRIHRQSVVHRDLKPGNFLIKHDGTVCLSDFGTARSLDEAEPALLQTYLWPAGDKRYSAPEVLIGLHDVDPHLQYQADIYSLGAILFELFTGVPLFHVAINPTTIDDLRAHMQAIRAQDRLRIYQSILGSLAAANALPSVADGGAPVPPSLRDRIDRLYRGLAAWDFRRRPYPGLHERGQRGATWASPGVGPLSPHAWATIFNAINAMLLVYKNEQRQAVRRALNARRRQARSRRQGGEQ